ncbi:MAG: tripartite tricarboxylate transporter substrate binding protein [Burkholderiales bacterium]|nr:tripartite tricarboxylate transporter substrate binding protein [Burkholderiales bacterium]
MTRRPAPIAFNRRRLLGAGGIAAALPRAARAQDYPSKPIRIVSPFSPGATSDLVARAIGPALAAAWGVSVVAENKPGGGSIVGADFVAKAAPDGHTLLVAAAAIGVIPALHAKLPFELYRDLLPLTLVGTVPFMMLVHPSVPAKTVQEFVAYAKANPAKVNYSSGGNGTIPHMGGALLNMRAGLAMPHVPFKGGADSLTALLGGQVQMTIDGGPHVIGHIRSGALRMLAVATPQRLPEFPDTPTIAESGFPGFESNAWQSMWVTGGTPPAVVRKIAAEVTRILRTPEMSERLKAMGMQPIGSSPEDAERFIRAETAKWGAVIKASGAKAE